MFQPGIIFVLAESACFAAAIFAMPAAVFRVSGRCSAGIFCGEPSYSQFLGHIPFLFRPSRKRSTQVFCVAKIVTQESGCVGVVHHIFTEILLMFRT